MKALIPFLLLGLMACQTSPQPQKAPTTPPVVSQPPQTTTPPVETTQPVKPDQSGYLEVCAIGLDRKIHTINVEVGGRRVWLDLNHPCKVLTDELTGKPIALPAGGRYEVIAHSGAWGERVSPEYQVATIHPDLVTTIWVTVSY